MLNQWFDSGCLLSSVGPPCGGLMVCPSPLFVVGFVHSVRCDWEELAEKLVG
jgi:hypothetical protein